MVRRKNDFPEKGELVIGTVKDINPYSVFVSLDEYPGRVGMVHVSEIARKWVRDVRDWVKIGEKIVCVVMETDREKDHVTLSMKRVDENQKNRRMQAWKRDEKGEKLLGILAREKNMTLEKIYEEIGFDIQENFRDMLEVFELAFRKGQEYIESRGVPKKWAKEICRIAQEKIKVPEVKIEEYVEFLFYSPDGIDKIKKVLTDVEKKGISVKYISAPKYKLSLMTKDPKEGEKFLKKVTEELSSEVKKLGGEFIISGEQ